MSLTNVTTDAKDMGDVFDAIADSWDSFRRKPFPPIVEDLAKEWGGRILDVGCGNGRNILAFKTHGEQDELVGVDISPNMVAAAVKHAESIVKRARFLVADARKLPFHDGHFDHVLCIAMLHHLPLDEQAKALAEIKRVMAQNGTMCITFWNKWQKRFFLGKRERMIPWTVKGEVINRYYYLHTIYSAKRLLRKAGFVIESSSGTFGPNVILLARKA